MAGLQKQWFPERRDFDKYSRSLMFTLLFMLSVFGSQLKAEILFASPSNFRIWNEGDGLLNPIVMFFC